MIKLEFKKYMSYLNIDAMSAFYIVFTLAEKISSKIKFRKFCLSEAIFSWYTVNTIFISHSNFRFDA